MYVQTVTRVPRVTRRGRTRTADPAELDVPLAQGRRLSPNLLDRYVEEMRLRNYSPRSIKTYRSCIRQFLVHCLPRHPRDVSSASIRAFLLAQLEAGKSRSRIDQHISALRLLYIDLYRRDDAALGIVRPKREQKLPDVPTRAEILGMADAVTNRKHRLAILFLYATGLRVSELVAADVGDLAPDRLSFLVRGGKGRKDRRTVVAASLTDQLEWLVFGRPAHAPLFPSRDGTRWTARSVQRVVSAAAGKAGLLKTVSCHSLRHAFATHLLEGGTPLVHIQGLLGHRSINTTTRYIRMVDPAAAHIASPL